MANDMNSVCLVGRLVREAILSYSNGGMAFAKFSIAVNRRTKKGDQWVDDASFFNCTLFGKSAESLNPYLIKGQQVAINGSLVQERWEQDGQNRSNVGIIVNSLTLLGSQQGAQNQSTSAPRSNPSLRPVVSNTEPMYGGPEMFDDNQIPF